MAERVLIVDDSRSVRCLLEQCLLSKGYQVMTAADGLQAIAILKEYGSPDLVLLDRVMPGVDGEQVCRWVREHDKDQGYKYLILLTAQTMTEEIVEGLACGADDYITKPFDVRELMARLEVGERIIGLQRNSWNTAIRDPLTGIYSRKAVNELLSIEIGRARRENRRLAVAMAGIDHFKRTNEQFGCVFGNAVLVGVAGIIRSYLQEFDIIGRFREDKFVFVFNCEENHVAFDLCERVRAEVMGKAFRQDESEAAVTVSIGMAIIDGTANYAEGIMTAERALYQAKREGRNRTAIYGNGME
jgi:diguanylate cyclase (GGDEF)-like protein